jgi:hypothetical protein
MSQHLLIAGFRYLYHLLTNLSQVSTMVKSMIVLLTGDDKNVIQEQINQYKAEIEAQ